MKYDNCDIIIKPYSEFSSKEKVSWIDNCNIAYGFDRATTIIQKYENNNNNLFCLLVDKSKIKASYSGFLCKSSKLKSFMSTDTFSLSRHSTSVLGNHLYDHLASLGCHFVFGWPNERIRKIRAHYLHWVYLGEKKVYFAYPRVWPRASLKFEKGPFVRSNGAFISRPQGRFVRPLDNFSIPTAQNYRSINITLGARNPYFFHIRIPGQSKLFGYRILCDEHTDLIKAAVDDLFTNADFSWIDVP